MPKWNGGAAGAWLACLVLPAFLVLTVACGGVDAPDHPDPLDHRDPTEGAVELHVTTDDVSFVPAALAATAGATTTLELENRDDVEHDFQIDVVDVTVLESPDSDDDHDGGHEGDGGFGVHADAGETSSATLVFNEAGTYEFYCTVSGHREAGMVGTLTVE